MKGDGVRGWKRYAEYMDSGVEWLGQVPAHWEIIQSKRMFRVRNEPAAEADEQLTASQKYGMLPQAEFIELEGRRVVATLKGTESLRHVEPNDFVISLRSFQGGIEWCRLRGSVTFHYVVLKPTKQLHPAYFGHVFKSGVYIQTLRSTTDFIRDGQDLRYSHFVLVSLPVVPLEEQIAIATFLDRETTRIDALIAKKERLIELLQEKRAALISHAVTKGLDPNVPMEDSGIPGLGRVPAAWRRLGTKRVISFITSGSRGWAEYYSDDGDLFIQSGNLDRRLGLDLSTVQRVVPPEGAEVARTRVVKHDVLVCVTGAYTGNVAVVEVDLPKAYVNQHVALLRPILSAVVPKFLAYSLSSYGAWHFMVSQYGGTKQGLGLADVLTAPIFLPSLGEQGAVVRHLDEGIARIDALIAKVRTVIDRLREYRTALISAAVTGKIDVRDEA